MADEILFEPTYTSITVNLQNYIDIDINRLPINKSFIETYRNRIYRIFRHQNGYLCGELKQPFNNFEEIPYKYKIKIHNGWDSNYLESEWIFSCNTFKIDYIPGIKNPKSASYKTIEFVRDQLKNAIDQIYDYREPYHYYNKS